MGHKNHIKSIIKKYQKVQVDKFQKRLKVNFNVLVTNFQSLKRANYTKLKNWLSSL